MKKLLLIIISVLIIAGLALYWFFFRVPPTTPATTEDGSSGVSFNPFNRGGGVKPTPAPQTGDSDSGITARPIENTGKLPRLRQISVTPVGGYMASTTASTTLVRYIDRGVGHVFEATDLNANIEKITNTTIPRVYESYWNKKASAAVIRYMRDDTGVVANFYAEIRDFPKNASSTGMNPRAEIKGKYLSSSIQEIAVSPKGDRIFTWNVENNTGVGYISNFDESKKTKIIEAPLTQVAIEWPEENTVTLTPKASGNSSGSLYTINLKQPLLKKALSSASGLTAKLSPDTKKILFSNSNLGGLHTSLFNTKTLKNEDVVFTTFMEKCVWSKLHTNEVYCAVPTSIPRGNYPDDWYKGNVSFTDQIWLLDTDTGDVHLIANPLTLGNVLMDSMNLVLDPQENYLYFTNKRDLTLWSLRLSEE